MKKNVCLLILLLQLYFSSAFAEGIVVAVSEQVKVGSPVITLGELAEISGSDTERIQNLRQLKLGAAPLPGSSFVLTKEVIDMRLGASGVDLSGVAWNIPNAVTVIGDSQVISGQLLIDKAVAAIRSQVGSDVGLDDLTISSVGQVQDAIVPPGSLAFTTTLPYGIRYNTPTTVTVDINVNERSITKVRLKFDVKLYRQVIIATREMNAREILTEDCLRYERMDIGHLPAGFVTDKTKIAGLMTRRTVTPGMVLTNSMVNRPAIVKQGSMVTLVAYIGNMKVTAGGQAMQNGCEGQLIRVLNVNSKRIVFGKILDEGTVQVLTYNGASNS